MDASPLGLRRSDLVGTVWPPIALGANAIFAALAAELEVTERLPPEEIARMQEAQLALVCAHHLEHTPWFAARLNAAGLAGLAIDSLERLRRVPLMSRRDAQSAGAALFSSHVPPAHQPTHEIFTSGSTGEPVKVRKTALQVLLWRAMAMRDLTWHSHDIMGRMSTVRANIKSYYERIGWGRPLDNLYASGPSQGIPIRTDISEQLRLIRQFNPDVLAIMPNNLRAMVDAWEVDGFEPRSLRQIRTIGETVDDDLRERVSRVAGIDIQDHYSTQEFGSIAMQCPAGGLYHVMSETVIVEVLRENDEACMEGESGRVVVTDLHNLATPMIRYDTGDHAEVGGDCPCGRGLPTLRRILGRERNLMLKPSGERHWPNLAKVNEPFRDQIPVRQFQIYQLGRTKLELRVVTDEPPTASDQAAMIKIIQTAFDFPFEIEIVRFEGSLPLSPNGKFEGFICKIPAEPPS